MYISPNALQRSNSLRKREYEKQNLAIYIYLQMLYKDPIVCEKGSLENKIQQYISPNALQKSNSLRKREHEKQNLAIYISKCFTKVKQFAKKGAWKTKSSNIYLQMLCKDQIVREKGSMENKIQQYISPNALQRSKSSRKKGAWKTKSSNIYLQMLYKDQIVRKKGSMENKIYICIYLQMLYTDQIVCERGSMENKIYKYISPNSLKRSNNLQKRENGKQNLQIYISKCFTKIKQFAKALRISLIVYFLHPNDNDCKMGSKDISR